MGDNLIGRIYGSGPYNPGSSPGPPAKNKNGALERIRTSDIKIRNLVLYPTELRTHI